MRTKQNLIGKVARIPMGLFCPTLETGLLARADGETSQPMVAMAQPVPLERGTSTHVCMAMLSFDSFVASVRDLKPLRSIWRYLRRNAGMSRNAAPTLITNIEMYPPSCFEVDIQIRT